MSSLGTTLARGIPERAYNKWPNRRVSELAELKYGKALVAGDRVEGSIPVYGSNGRCGFHNRPLFKGPGIICGRKGQGPLGVEWSDSDYWVIDTAYSLIPTSGDLDLRFAYYLFKHIGLNHLKDGTSNPSLSRDTFNAQKIPLPPIGYQRSVASVLSLLDNKIELNRKTNATLEQMARTIFKSWFIDFDPVRAKEQAKKPLGIDDTSAAAFPDSFEKSELGEIPNGWRVYPLGDWLDVLETGNRPKGGVSGYTEGVPSVGAESIVGLGNFDFSKTKYVPHEYYEALPRGKVFDRDILLYKDGGRPGLFEPHLTMFGNGFPFAKFAINEHVYRIRGKAPLNQNFLFFWLSSPLILDEMRIKGTGVAIPGLNSTAVRSLKVLIPSSACLSRFSEVIEPLIRMILSNSLESLGLAKTRDLFLPGLLSGEIDLEGAAT